MPTTAKPRSYRLRRGTAEPRKAVMLRVNLPCADALKLITPDGSPSSAVEALVAAAATTRKAGGEARATRRPAPRPRAARQGQHARK